MVDYEILAVEKWTLTSEGKEVAEIGSHEARVFNAIPEGAEGIKIDDMVVWLWLWCDWVL